MFIDTLIMDMNDTAILGFLLFLGSVLCFFLTFQDQNYTHSYFNMSRPLRFLFVVMID